VLARTKQAVNNWNSFERMLLIWYHHHKTHLKTFGNKKHNTVRLLWRILGWALMRFAHKNVCQIVQHHKNPSPKKPKTNFCSTLQHNRGTHLVIYGGCIREKSLISTLKTEIKTRWKRTFSGKMLLYTRFGIHFDLKFVDCMLAAVQ
jgi:hypothetical protein